MRELSQDYGPVVRDERFPDVSKLLWISEQAFQKCSQHVDAAPEKYASREGNVITILMHHAYNVSYSVRLLTTYVQLLEAHALLRTRLEQVIKCSYLLHVDPKDGLIPFMQDVGRVDHAMSQYVRRQDSDLYDLMIKIFPDKIEEARERAVEQEKQIDPDFDPEAGKIKEGWTDLNTYDMAKKRDGMISDDDPITGNKLQWYYLTLYKSACKFIHSGAACLTKNFITVRDTNRGLEVGPQITYLFTNLLQVAHLDILQCYEVMKYFGAEKEAETLVSLHEQYKEIVPLEAVLDMG